MAREETGADEGQGLVQQVLMEEAVEYERLHNGPAAAAVLAAGVGSLALGLLTVLAEASMPLRNALSLYTPAGPLTGKTTGAVAIWLVVWLALHLAWGQREVDFGKVFAATLVLIALGLLGTFPPVFELFGG